MAFLHFMAIMPRLRKSKRQGQQAPYSQSNSLKPLPHTTQRETNQTQTSFRMAFFHFVVTRAPKSKCHKTLNLMPSATPTQNPMRNPPNTIRLPHGNITLYGHSSSPKTDQAPRSTPHALNINPFPLLPPPPLPPPSSPCVECHRPSLGLPGRRGARPSFHRQRT